MLNSPILETLDKFDIAILQELQADGRLSNAELSTRVGLSAAPCWRRVRALEEGGYIKGYRAEIDRHKIGLGVLAFVRLDAGEPLAPDEFLMRYRIRDRQVKFATNAFFFQEGQADRYATARYGEFRIAADGNAILTGLRGKDLEPLGEDPRR